MSKGPVSAFIEHHYRHFNAASLVEAAHGYTHHLESGGKMFLTMAGAMSTAEIGLSLAEMIRQDKVHGICCTGANLEEDVFNLVAHDFYERIPNWRDLAPAEEQDLLERHMNRVTDTCIPEAEAMRRIESVILKEWVAADARASAYFLTSFSIGFCATRNSRKASRSTVAIAGFTPPCRRTCRCSFQVGKIPR